MTTVQVLLAGEGGGAVGGVGEVAGEGEGEREGLGAGVADGDGLRAAGGRW